MTSAHSAKETEKWQLTKDETPAKTANPSLRSRMNSLSTPRVTTSQRAKEWRTIGSLRSKPRRKTQSRVHHKCETLPKFRIANWKWGSVRKYGMIESVYPTQPRITMETPSRKLQTNRLLRPLSNCQVSMTPESQSKERAEPHSGKQKAQYQNNLRMKQIGHRHPMPLIPK